MTDGRASVWICNTEAKTQGCGYIGLYVPEQDNSDLLRRCPGCGLTWPYHKTDDIALIRMEEPR